MGGRALPGDREWVRPRRVDSAQAHECYHACMAKQLTVRGVPDEVARRLDSLSRMRRKSVNATVLDILRDAVGVQERKRRLARYATWNEEDLAEFERALADQRRVDEELWR